MYLKWHRRCKDGKADRDVPAHAQDYGVQVRLSEFRLKRPRRWGELFGVQYDVLLYDSTSTYFESDPPFPPGDKRRYEYSRDHRPDCVHVVIALVVTPEGFPLAYEVMPGNTVDSTWCF